MKHLLDDQHGLDSLAIEKAPQRADIRQKISQDWFMHSGFIIIIKFGVETPPRLLKNLGTKSH